LERIVRSTVDLHGERGAYATTYAMIAERAGVSVQTVYNHFPDRGALFDACTGHATAAAPPLDRSCFVDLESARERLAQLARAVYARHAHLARWMRHAWREAALMPELQVMLERGRAELRGLIAEAAAPAFAGQAPAEFADLALALLDYPAWETMTERRASADAAEAACRALAALLAHHPATTTGASR
jgi:AcrR family transcriptional regulator